MTVPVTSSRDGQYNQPVESTHDDQEAWLRPALLIESFSKTNSLSVTFNHVERTIAPSGTQWQESKLEHPIYINDEDLELHPPLVDLRRRLGLETHRIVPIP
ncbi:MAG: hypothetical protein HC933_00845, partial [Pleurocapsa sp. SU_196_0]|nr:hypothetical protein [Pleurocapsa sp. SU_196_0]